MVWKILMGLGVFVGGVWLFNASWLVGPAEDGATRLIAHRGVHQTYSPIGLQNDSCTAERIYPPAHSFLENTIPSMQAAFAAGADIVELDVHLTTDGHWAVFHDWTLDCRTDGAGRTRDAARSDLKALDIGYGYTADDGETFPFRGQGIGLMPMLDEVIDAFPDGRFLVNFKSNNPEEGEAFAAFLKAQANWQDNVVGVYGGPRAVIAAREGLDGLKGFERAQLKTCLVRYLAFGWTGHVPGACRDTTIMIPVSHARWLWGWPHKFTMRMKRAGTTVYLTGPHGGRSFSTGIDTPELAETVPEDFDGYVWTNRIELVGPYLHERQ